MESQRATANELTFEIDNLKWQSHCQSNFIINTLLLLKEPLSEQRQRATVRATLLFDSVTRSVSWASGLLYMPATDSTYGCNRLTYGCNRIYMCSCNSLYIWMHRFSLSFDSVTQGDSWASGLLYMAATDSNMAAIEYIYSCNRLYIWLQQTLIIMCLHACVYDVSHCSPVGRLRLVGSLKLQVSFAKEPYERDDILQKRPMLLRSLLIVATPYK